MAFADYFDRNLQAASRLLQGFDPDLFKGILEKEVVGIAFDEAGFASAEGAATLDLTVRLLARLYPTLALAPLDDAAKKQSKIYEALAKKINPKISLRKSTTDVTRCLVIGRSSPALAGADKPSVIYIGSDKWIAKLSTKAPAGSGRSTNPFGAGAAACFGVANIFRLTFAAQLSGSKADSQISFSVLDMASAAAKPKNNPTLRDFDIGEMHLVGAGAVGNGFLRVMARLQCKGELHVVDGEKLASSNLQRYSMTSPGDEDKFKVDLAKDWLSGNKLLIHAHSLAWEAYVESRNNWRFERVAVAVDSAETRINVQSSLPRTVFNSWTQAGEVGLSRHTFIGEEACLACLYLPTEPTLSLDRIVARALRLPEDDQQLMDLRRRLDLGEPTERAFLERVSTAASIPIERLLPFEGKPLRAFYVEAVCGGAVMDFATAGGENRADVPMAFQSALAGILLAADVVAHAAGLRAPLPTVTQINLLNALPQFLSRTKHKQPGTRCICVDEDFVRTYRAKYRVAV